MRELGIHDGCNLCNEEFGRASVIGELVDVPHYGTEHLMLRDGEPIDVVCPRCQSRGRIRVLANILETAGMFVSHQRPALFVSAANPERRVLTRFFQYSDRISLHGDHSDPSCRVGIDITRMPEIQSSHYDAAFACVVLDYIPELDKAMCEVSRCLASNGSFFFYIQPWRISDGDTPPIVLHRNALAHEKYAAKESGSTGIPDCRFTLGWLHFAAKSAGLALHVMERRDPISELKFKWFIARKQQQ